MHSELEVGLAGEFGTVDVQVGWAFGADSSGVFPPAFVGQPAFGWVCV